MNREKIDYVCATEDRLSLLSELLYRKNIPVRAFVWKFSEHRRNGDTLCFSVNGADIMKAAAEYKYSFDNGGCVELVADIDSGGLYHCDSAFTYLYIPALTDLGMHIIPTSEDKEIDNAIRLVNGQK